MTPRRAFLLPYGNGGQCPSLPQYAVGTYGTSRWEVQRSDHNGTRLEAITETRQEADEYIAAAELADWWSE
jgi:hypothetical protein